jgi:hypothetical protein
VRGRGHKQLFCRKFLLPKTTFDGIHRSGVVSLRATERWVYIIVRVTIGAGDKLQVQRNATAGKRTCRLTRRRGGDIEVVQTCI